MSLASKLAEERRARLGAERLLELKQGELFAANRKLGRHAKALQGEVVEQRAVVENVRSENQRVKAELGVANQKVEVAERRLWHSIQTITDGFAFFNSDNELIAANWAYMDVFDGLDMVKPGISYVTILQLLTEEGIVNTEDLHPTDWRQMMLERWMMPQPEPVTVRLWNNLYIKLVDRRGEGGDIVSLGLNITESVEYQEKLKNARIEAESANRAKSAFLANMSHEIRTPMNGVVGMAEILADSGITEEQQLYVDTIKNSGEALLVIINDVLDYSKIEADKLELHSEPFDLERSIHEILMLLQPSAHDKGLTLLMDFDLFLPTKYVGDAGRIRQVLTNLMGNAVKFTQTGHVLVRVTGIPDSDTNDCQINISIEDTGIGIPEDKVDHIFGEFNQVENERNRQFDGTGLGLAISKRLVGLMGGEIWVTSEEGVGSCFGFCVRMPMTDGDEVEHPKIPSSLRQVMVVDNLEANRQILEHQLLQMGLGVVLCDSAKQALEVLDSSVDLILTDHSMLDMDGMEFAAEVRAIGNTTPIFLLSSNLRFAANDPSRSYVDAILQKPVSRHDLFRRIEGLASDDAPAIEDAVVLSEDAVEDPESIPDDTSIAEVDVGFDADGIGDLPSESEPAGIELVDEMPEPEPEAEIALPSFVSSRRRHVEQAEPEHIAEEPTASDKDEDTEGSAKDNADLQDTDVIPELETSSDTFMFETPDEEPSEPPTDGLETPEHDEILPDVAIEPDAALAIDTPLPDEGALDQLTESEPEIVEEEPQTIEEPLAEAQSERCDFVSEPRKLRVLAAEDNKTNQLVFRKMLKDLDLDLTFAANGQEAVALFKELNPDMIFMDISMPIMDGREATIEIRKIEEETGEHVPIIAMTAHTLSGDETEILASGIDHYLTKPLRKPLIHQKIAELSPQDVLPPIPVEIQELAS
ncbi:MAG: response regulator [Paracoccaceae bacterium]